MSEGPWTFGDIEPSEQLDGRVRRRMHAVAERRARAPRRGARATSPARRSAPFLPLERAFYVLLLAVYALYSGARTVQVLQERGTLFSQRHDARSSAQTSSRCMLETQSRPPNSTMRSLPSS